MTTHNITGLRASLGALCFVLAFCAALLLGTSSGEGWAMTYYVSADGDDGNPGTLDLPWRTIQRAAGTLVAGDTVYIREGVYRERVVPQHSGEHGKYITYSAYPGEKVTLDGADIQTDRRWGWGGLFQIEERAYITVTGLRVVNSPSMGIHARSSRHLLIEKNYTCDTGSSGIGIWRCYNVVINGNEVDRACMGRGQENLTVAHSDHVMVTDNHVHHGGKEGIDTKDGSSNVVVRGNHVHHNRRLGIYVDAWNKHTFNVDVVGNIVHDCGGCGFAAASERGGLLENVRFINNIAYRNKSAGIAVAGWNGDYDHPIHNVRIINNVTYNNGWPDHTWGGGIAVELSDARDILIRNNICSQNRDWQIRDYLGGSQVTIDHNLVHGFRGADNEVRGADSVEGDPLFVNPEQADFHLRSGSPAIDSGASNDAPADDLDGAPRPQGSAWDIGAYESG